MRALEALIRPARADEVGALQALEIAAAGAFAGAPGHAFCAAMPPRDAAEHERVRQTGVSLVIETIGGTAGRALAGFVLLLALDGRGHVLEAAVETKLQRRGLGRLLFSAADHWARQVGFPELTLTAYRDVPWNAPFYERLGYEVFTPGDDRPELRAIIDEETRAGFARQPRVAMRRPVSA